MEEFFLLTQGFNFSNLDLLSVGITVSAISLLGFIVYISNTKSATNVSFLLFCAVTMLWSFFNYLSYQTKDSEMMIILWRVVIFLAIWHSFSFFNFLFSFPKERWFFPKWYKFILFPFIIIFSFVSLFTGFIFSRVEVIDNKLSVVAEKGIIVFVFIAISLVVASFFFLIKRIIHIKKEDRNPYIIILIGAIITFILLLSFNLILPALFENTKFISVGAVTFFPFSIFTAYAISKHKTFKVVNIGSSLMAFAICVITFIEIIFAQSVGHLIIRSGVFLFVLLISIQFVKNIFAFEVLNQNLEKANEQLKSLDKLKSEFISLASHQLRSPLTVIKGYASTLSDGVVGEMNSKQKEIVRHIYISAQGLASLVEDFLNVTKIEQGGMKYVFEGVDIKKIVNDLFSDMKIVAIDKKLDFNLKIEEKNNYFAKADQTKIKQVFLNLIDNSIKYTKSGYVNVSLNKDEVENMIIFSVSDSGVGINEETKKKLFSKFGRGDSSLLNSGGSGLGLYLAQEIVKSHGGDILVESEGEGKGSTFVVRFPSI